MQNSLLTRNEMGKRETLTLSAMADGVVKGQVKWKFIHLPPPNKKPKTAGVKI